MPASSKGHIPVVKPVDNVSSSSVATSLFHYLNKLTLQQQTTDIWSWLKYVNEHMPLVQVYGTKQDIFPNKPDEPEEKPDWMTFSSGNFFKDLYKHIWKIIAKSYVALYGQNAINRIDPGAT